MVSAISRERAQEDFSKSLAEFIPISAQWKEAEGQRREASLVIDRVNKEFGSQRWWKRLWGWVLDKTSIEPIVSQQLKDNLEESRVRTKTLDRQYGEVHRQLATYGENLPGLHCFTSLRYDPSDPNGTPWHLRMGIDIAEEGLTTVWSKPAFSELRFQTARKQEMNGVFIPKDDKLFPVLQLTSGTSIAVGVAGSDGGPHYFSPPTTRRALVLSADDLIRHS